MKQYFGYVLALCIAIIIVYVYLTLSSKIKKNNALIDELSSAGTEQISNIQTNIRANRDNILTNEGSISANTTLIGQNKTDYTALIGANTASIGANTTDYINRVAGNTALIGANTTLIGENTDYIGTNTTDGLRGGVAANEDAINVLRTFARGKAGIAHIHTGGILEDMEPSPSPGMPIPDVDLWEDAENRSGSLYELLRLYMVNPEAPTSAVSRVSMNHRMGIWSYLFSDAIDWSQIENPSDEMTGDALRAALFSRIVFKLENGLNLEGAVIQDSGDDMNAALLPVQVNETFAEIFNTDSTDGVARPIEGVEYAFLIDTSHQMIRDNIANNMVPDESYYNETIGDGLINRMTAALLAVFDSSPADEVYEIDFQHFHRVIDMLSEMLTKDKHIAIAWEKHNPWEIWWETWFANKGAPTLEDELQRNTMGLYTFFSVTGGFDAIGFNCIYRINFPDAPPHEPYVQMAPMPYLIGQSSGAEVTWTNLFPLKNLKRKLEIYVGIHRIFYDGGFSELGEIVGEDVMNAIINDSWKYSYKSLGCINYFQNRNPPGVPLIFGEEFNRGPDDVGAGADNWINWVLNMSEELTDLVGIDQTLYNMRQPRLGPPQRWTDGERDRIMVKNIIDYNVLARNQRIEDFGFENEGDGADLALKTTDNILPDDQQNYN